MPIRLFAPIHGFGRVFGALSILAVGVALFAGRLATADISRAPVRPAAGAAIAEGPGLRGLIDAEQAADADRIANASHLAQQLLALRRRAGGKLRLSSLPPAVAQSVNAIFPISPDQNPPARPFVFHGSAADRAAATACLTQAVYYEAGYEPAAGGEAVAQVVLNRVRHPIFPHTVCGVVYQGADLKTGCQFSFTCDGSLGRAPQRAAWARARQIAQRALAGHVMAAVGDATHYHTEWVVPWWRPTVTKVGQVGVQIFYRWPGALGRPGAFNARYAGHERIAATSTAPRHGPMSPVERLAALAAAARAEADPAAAHIPATEQATR